jgi:hypothetical protein
LFIIYFSFGFFSDCDSVLTEIATTQKNEKLLEKQESKTERKGSPEGTEKENLTRSDEMVVIENINEGFTKDINEFNSESILPPQTVSENTSEESGSDELEVDIYFIYISFFPFPFEFFSEEEAKVVISTKQKKETVIKVLIIREFLKSTINSPKPTTKECKA